MRKKILTFETVTKDEQILAKELQQKLVGCDIAGMIFFCSSQYNLQSLAESLRNTFSFNISGCTTAGEIASHYQTGGFVAICFLRDSFHIHTHFIANLLDFTPHNAQLMRDKTIANLKYSQALNYQEMFGFLMIDGLSTMEESVAGILFAAFNKIDIIGGSAGDDLQFVETQVYHQGKFYSNAAIFLLIESTVPFEIFKLQNFTPLNIEMVVTAADPKKRIVYEINGTPAAVEYAKLIGIDVQQLSEKVFAMRPVMLQVGNGWYVRSILKANEDGSLTFGSAIDIGVPLTVAKGNDVLQTLSSVVKKMQNKFTTIDATLGCDCIFRKIEIQQKKQLEVVEAELQKIKLIGFSTYGEQYNSLHINQTFTAITFGEKSIKSAIK